MISWLKGKIIKNWHISSKRGVVLNVGGVGYEVQLLSKQINLNDNSIAKEFWIHQINREDYTNLYGFSQVNQRDLFRKIISVNGIGPQIGMNLLDSIHDFLKSNIYLSTSKKINIIYEVYKNNSISDSIYRILNETNDWNSIDHILTFNTFSTIYHIQKNKLSFR